MKKNNVTQLVLLIVGVFLIIATYYYYPKINQNNIDYTAKKEKIEEEIIKLKEVEKNLVDKLQETKEDLSGGDLTKKNYLEKIQKKLNETSSLIEEKKLSLEKIEKTILAKKEAGPEIISNDDQINKFEKLEYKGAYNQDPFIVKSEKAHILSENPNLVYMTKMHVILSLNDGRVVHITSDQGSYDKVTYDCLFEKNVRATDGEVKILADNLDLLATKDSVEIYNNVNLKHPTGSLLADKIDYNFNTKFFKVSMFGQEKVKMKVVQ
ncbi:hypothetical protein N8084_02040 [Pelagibacteraceae bacterium]|nr:hypothetical protein [Pelagibacteraceae bacterium]